ncbi:hypothetical protein HMPREF0574_0113 [Mobiluncus curtisii subsp. curtisii ATCC 35241]|nr:hypothetical protein HMPREF0574_0113 [Mobiluncus curtisii subsp. curtisii ATCC 35241]
MGFGLQLPLLAAAALFPPLIHTERDTQEGFKPIDTEIEVINTGI